MMHNTHYMLSLTMKDSLFKKRLPVVLKKKKRHLFHALGTE